MKKRLLGLILALAMVMSLVPFALATSDTYASDTEAVTAGMTARIGAEGTGTYYSTLRKAVIAAHEETDSAERQQETIITLLDDVSDGQGIAIGYGSFNDETGVTSSSYNPINITIDLNEKTYTITRDYVGSNTTNTNGFQLLRGSTVKIKNGSITSTTNKIFVQNYSDLTLEDVNLNVPNASYAVSCNFGDSVILGDTSITTNNTAIDVYYWPNNGYGDGVGLTVNTTGTIQGTITYGSDNSNTGKQDVAEKAALNIQSGTFTGAISTYYLGTDSDTGIEIIGGTFTNENSQDNIVQYIPEGMTLDTNGQVVIADDAVASVNGVGYTTLQEAIEKAPENGTVVLLQDVTNDNVGISAQSDTVLAINKTITIQGNGNSISVDLSVPSRFGDRDQIFSIGETKTSTAVVTLDNVTMNLTGKEGGKGDIFDMWSTLNITNGSNITISNAQSAFTMQGGMNAKVNLNASAVTANTINGNFSNGGVWDIENGSVLDINGCGTHGLSVEKVTIDNSTVTVDGTGYVAIYGSKVELLNGANVIVTNSATSEALASTDYAGRGAVQLKNGTGTLTMTNSTLSLSGNGNGANTGEQSIYIGNGNLANTNSIITGTLVLAEGTSSHVVTFMSEGQQYTAHVVTDSVTMPAAPSRPGHAFLGWSDGSRTYQPGETATISGNTTFTALWQYIPPADPSYQITIPATANGTVTVSPTSAKEDQVVTITVTPNSGYELAALTVTDRSGNRVTVTANPDGTYRFVMPASQVTVSAVFAPAQLPFTDVTEANWYYDEVYYVWANGLMQGTSATTFGPNVDTTRAMVVTILWRLEGEPASGYDMDYSDVAGGAWYADAVRWATEHGIVNGSEGQFYPGGTVTREQLAAMLYRYAQYKGYDLTAGGDLSGFADAGAVSGWAETSLAWAVGQRLIQGSANQIDPTGSAIRAQLAAILMRFMENVAN